MLGLTVRYFKEVEDLCPKNDNQSAIESNDIFHTEWANNTAALTNHENSLKDLREEVQYRKSILTGFSKLEKIRGGRGVSGKCSMPADQGHHKPPKRDTSHYALPIHVYKMYLLLIH